MKNKLMSKKLINVLISVIILIIVALFIYNTVSSFTQNVNATSIDDLNYENLPKDYTSYEVDFIVTNDSERFYINGEEIVDEIKITPNTMLTVNVINNSDYEMTLHFHGVKALNKMDGVPGMTQNPISSNSNFTYEFYFDQESIGTYMYHSHLDTVNQVNNENLFGGIVVTDDINENSDTLIINSEVTDLDAHHDAADSGESITINNTLNYKIDVNTDQKIILHIVNLASIETYINFGDDVEYKITNLDAIESESQTLKNKTLKLPTANRITVEIISNNENLVVSTQNNYKPQNASASFDGSAQIKSDDDVISLYDIIKSKEYLLDSNTKATDSYNFSLDATMSTWTMNGESFPNITPITTNLGDVVELTLNNDGHMPEPHPFHLHGHVFQVIEINGQKLDYPLVMDTYSVERKESVKIRFIAENPGFWAFHCHDLTHAAKGMVTSVQYNGYSSKYISKESYE